MSFLTRVFNRVQCSRVVCTTQRFASTSITVNRPLVEPAVLLYSPPKNTVSAATVSEYVSRLRPFSVPPQPQVIEELEMTSVLRKRRLKMNKHKHKKLRKRTRALRKKLGK